MDQNVVKAALQGDPAAFTYIYNHTFDKALAIAQGFVKNEHDAFDVVQDAYIKMWEKLGTLDDPSKLEFWFYTIVRNKAKDFLGSKAHTDFVAFSDVESGAQDDGFSFADTIESNYRPFSPEASVDYAETQSLLWGIVNKLPEKQRICVTLRWKEDMKIRQIAEATGMAESTVKSCLNYGHKKIGEEVQELEKKGIKLYGISPLIFLPFLRWILGGTTAASEGAAAAQVAYGASYAASATVATASATATASSAAAASAAGATASAAAVSTGAATQAVAAGVAGKVVKKGAKAVLKRIVAGVCATAAVTAAAVTVPIKDGKTAADYLSDGIYAISQIGKPKAGDYVDTYRENEVELSFIVFSGEYSYRIPQLNFEGPDVAAVNQEILDTMQPLAEQIDQAGSSFIPPLVDKLDYSAWLNGDVLTLELQTSWSLVSSDWDTNIYYCIDTATGAMVTNQQILAEIGMSEAEFFTLAEKKVSADLQNLLKKSAEGINEVLSLLGIDPIFTQEHLLELTQLTVSRENLENVTLYYGKRGTVMMQYQIRYSDGLTGLFHSVKIK